MRYDKDGITVTDTEQGDILELSDLLRESDIVELKALGLSPLEGVQGSFSAAAQSYTVKIKGTPIAMFGLTPDVLDGSKALVWMLATDTLEEIQRRFLKHSKDFIKEALELYSTLYNYVDCRNEQSIIWLKWLGADFFPSKPHGLNHEQFYYFEFKRKAEVAVKQDTRLNTPARKKIAAFEAALAKHPGAIFADDHNAPPLKHDFTDGLYTRTITIPKGMILTGKIHKHDHPNFLMEGSVLVYTEAGGSERLDAPKVMMSKAGTKRVVYTLTKTVWSTVHLNPTNTRDLDKLENIVIAKNYDAVEYKEEGKI